jgi:hypothetical protein
MEDELAPMPAMVQKGPKETTEAVSYLRHCSTCLTWLGYKTEGPSGARRTYSFCPNEACPRFGHEVQDVLVS